MDRKQIIIAAALLLLILPCYAQTEYRVQPGDTVYGVSRKFDVEPSLLMKVNGIGDPSRLKVGQLLTIPGSYEVKPGDTYYGIARTLGISVEELLKLNNRTEASVLLAGDTLQIPGGTAAVSASKPADTEISGSGTAFTSVPAETASADSRRKAFFWPHTGSRSSLTGKLKGAQFNGEPGDSVFSVSSGKVIWVAPYRGYNKLIIVESPDTHIYAYGGNDLCLVTVGDQVFPGMEIGKLGVNPHEGSAKAFFFVYKNGTPVDPEKAPRS